MDLRADGKRLNALVIALWKKSKVLSPSALTHVHHVIASCMGREGTIVNLCRQFSYHYHPPTPMAENASDRAPSMVASTGDFQGPTKSQEGEAHLISSHPVSTSHCSHRESLIGNNMQGDMALNKQQSTPSPPVGEEVVSPYHACTGDVHVSELLKVPDSQSRGATEDASRSKASSANSVSIIQNSKWTYHSTISRHPLVKQRMLLPVRYSRMQWMQAYVVGPWIIRFGC